MKYQAILYSLLCLLSGFFFAPTALADHFRFAHVTWQRTSDPNDHPRNVDITVTEGFRADEVDSFAYQIADDTGILFSFSSAGMPIVASGTDVAGQEYRVKKGTVTGVLPHDGPFLVTNFPMCCRVDHLENAPDGEMRFSMTMDLRNNNQGSPVVSMPVVLQMTEASLNTIPLAIADPDGDLPSCRLSTFEESLIPTIPTAGGLSLSVSSDGVLSWDTSGTTAGQVYAAQVFIEENNPLADSSIGTGHVTFDFIIEIVPGSENTPPTCSEVAGTHIVPVGTTFTAAVIAQDADGDPLTLSLIAAPPGAMLTPAAGTTMPEPAEAVFEWTPQPSDSGSAQAVTFKFVDPGGLEAVCNFAIEVPLEAPILNEIGPFQVEEGGTVELSATGLDPAGGFLTFAWDLDDDGVFETAGQTVMFDTTGLDGPMAAAVAVQASNSQTSTTSGATVNILNVAPTVDGITTPGQPVGLGTAIAVSANFTDPGLPDSHTAEWDWGDGTSSAGDVLPGTEGFKTTTASHTYTAAGVYPVTVTVTDDEGDSGSSTFESVVVFDGQGGCVTGGGWLYSPPGAYRSEPNMTGRVYFAVVSKYKKRASALCGQTVFRLRAAGFNFHSTDYEWLVVVGQKALCKGHGTVNGSGDYDFLLTAIDGDAPGVDTFDQLRLQIWDSETGETLYDNESASGNLIRGSIALHQSSPGPANHRRGR